MNPHISLPSTQTQPGQRPNHAPSPFISTPTLATPRKSSTFAGTSNSNSNFNVFGGIGSGIGARGTGTGSGEQQMRMPRFFKRLFKWPQMDFQMAAWEMRNLIVAPKSVFRTIYYNKQTRNSWHRPDPSFVHLLILLLLPTALLWSTFYSRMASVSSFIADALHVNVMFVFAHFLGGSLLSAVASYFIVGRLLGPGMVVSLGLPGLVRGGRGGFRWRRRRRRRGLFVQDGEGEGERLEFGYCFDVSTRAFLPVWLFVYVLQLLLMPFISRDYWISLLLGNTLYLFAWSYYFVILFLGYNALPFLHHTEFLLLPVAFGVFAWLVSLSGIHLVHRFAPIRWAGM